ncbi:MAG TPA: hypothetical protein VD863_26440 [Bradyrhizobium sp.]|jgi:hypothetical protein|nr:hypothetical protein [Bradyrhizobium sp.]
MDLIAQFVAAMTGRLLDRFRRLLDRLPDRDPSTLPWWHRLARLTVGIAVCLAILLPLGWLIWR